MVSHEEEQRPLLKPIPIELGSNDDVPTVKTSLVEEGDQSPPAEAPVKPRRRLRLSKDDPGVAEEGNEQTPTSQSEKRTPRWWRRRKPDEVPVYLKKPCEETRAKGIRLGLLDSEGDDSLVYYDEHLHWLGLVFIVFNPMWLVDTAIAPRVEDEKRQKPMLLDRFIWGVQRLCVRIAQFIAAGVLAVCGASIMLTSWFDSPPWGAYPLHSSLFWAGCIVFLACVFGVWCLYMLPVAKRFRIVVTRYSIWVWAEQTPWRPQFSIQLEAEKLNGCDFSQSTVEGWVGTARVIPTTNDPKEKIPVWLFAKKWRELVSAIILIMKEAKGR